MNFQGIQPKILEITNEIVHAFKDHFFQNTWMNQLTVNKTLFKLEKAQWYLGESDAYLGKSSIQSYYKAVSFFTFVKHPSYRSNGNPMILSKGTFI